MIESISPNSEEYEEASKFINAPVTRFDYEEFTDEYNASEVEAILVFEYKGSMISNFVKVLKNRSLDKGVDYECRSTQAKAERGTYKVVLKKLTEKKCNEL